MYSSDLRTDLLATNGIASWACSDKVPPELLLWLSQGRPFTGEFI